VLAVGRSAGSVGVLVRGPGRSGLASRTPDRAYRRAAGPNRPRPATRWQRPWAGVDVMLSTLRV